MVLRVIALSFWIAGTVQAAQLVVEVADDKESPMPLRAWVESDGKRLYEPLSEVSIPYLKDRSFSCYGTFTMELP
ncbi:MAG: hypothetical protein CMO80_12255 [Verrucomicrobiales bacterium]|nr:hypothetical protein [Verrucomicrobiales bacterium]|tara:strand:+ start:282 stop:506 length:225 start_codon:yes stop_codon:yes gene_type:complete